MSALPPLLSTEWSEVASAHLYNFLSRTPRDQWFKKHPGLAWFEANQEEVDGGDRWAWPVLDSSEPVGRSYIGTQGHTMQDVKVAQMAETDPKFYAEPIFIAHTDQVKAGGDKALFNLLEQKVRHAELRRRRKKAKWIFAATQALTTDANTVYEAVPINPVTSGAFNGLDGAAAKQPYWRNKTKTSTGAFAANGVIKLDELLNEIAEEAGDPDILITTKEIYAFIQQWARSKYSLNAQVTTKTGKQMADAGIPVLYFNGIPIIHEPEAVAGKILALSATAIKWRAVAGGGDGGMMGDGFEKTQVAGVMGQQAYLRLEGNLVVEERRALGQVDGITAA